MGNHPSGLAVVGGPVQFNARYGLVDCGKLGGNCAGNLGGEGHFVAESAVTIQVTAVGFHAHSVFGLAVEALELIGGNAFVDGDNDIALLTVFGKHIVGGGVAVHVPGQVCGMGSDVGVGKIGWCRASNGGSEGADVAASFLFTAVANAIDLNLVGSLGCQTCKRSAGYSGIGSDRLPSTSFKVSTYCDVINE